MSGGAGRWTAFAAGVLLLGGLALGRAAAAEDFYHGKTITLLIGHEAGTEYDTHARLIARFLPLHIPGNPTIVPQNMLGASGMRVANYLYNAAPRDGTTMGMMADSILQNQVFGQPGVQYDAGRLLWIGSMTTTSELVIAWAATGIRTLEDARRRDVVIGTATKLTIHYAMAMLMNEFLGTRFKVVTGYKGGNDMNLAVERGEVDARVIAWSALKSDMPQWIAANKIGILAQMGPIAADLPAVPNVEALIAKPEDRDLVALFVAANRLGRPLATTPDVPQDRLAVLRRAFDATMTDVAFLAAAKAARVDLNPVKGIEMQAEASRVLATDPAIVERAKALIR